MPTFELEPVTRTKRTEQEIDAALTAVALCGGRVSRAHEQLKVAGFNVPYDTLVQWVSMRFPNRYRHLAEQVAPQIEKSMVATARAAAMRSFEVAGEAVELEAQRLAAGDVKDAAASSRNLATTGGIMTDKMLLLDGRPTQISEQRSMDDVLRSLAAKGFIDGTATEEETADAGIAER